MNSDYLYDMIDVIAQTSSTKTKKRMLVPELKRVLEYTYDPFKTYGVKRFTRRGRLNGKEFDENVWNLLDHLAARSLTGNKATAYVEKFLGNLSFKSAALLKCILTKDLHCGVSIKSINDVFPDLIRDAITMQPNEYVSKLSTYPLLAGVKLRGNRALLRGGQLLSRRGKMFYGCDHIIDELRIFGCEFDGELLIPGIPFETGSGIIRNRKKTPQVRYCIFDTPDDSVYRFQDRYLLYMAMIKDMKYCVPVHHHLIKTEAHLFIFNHKSLENGYEGTVAKDPLSYYKPGYSNSWWKLKELQEPIDLEVIDVYEGKDKYTGMLGGVIVYYNGVTVRVGGGFSDPQRILYWADPNMLIGSTIEVEYQEVTKHMSLRNPIFKGIREDK